MSENNSKISTRTKLEIAVESGLQLIPFVGGSIASAYFGTKQAREFQRIEQFYTELANEILEIKENIASLDAQDEEGLVSLIEQVNDKIEHEHQTAKIIAYKNYMKNILLNPVNNTNYDKRKVFLDILKDMSLLECEIIIVLYKNSAIWAKVKDIRKPNVNQYAIVGAISKLKSYGFLRTSQGNFSIGGNDDNLLEENVLINEYGKEFTEFVLV
jgi:hypothetical protein